jgi:tRNA threonylcarbamoyladenosine biosynthesis protein TsaB
MGEAYLAMYNGDPQGRLRDAVPDCLVDPEQFKLPSDHRFFAAGPGWSTYPVLLDNHAAQIVGSDFALMPSALDVLVLAAEQFRDGRTVAAAQALPNYIRDKVTD